MPGEYIKDAVCKSGEDIFRILNHEDLLELKEVYKNRSKTEPHVISLIDTKLKWNSDNIKDDLLLFLSPGDSYKVDGTFIVLKQIQAHELFVYTLDRKCERLYEGLLNTKRIDFNKVHLFVFVNTQHHWTVLRVIEDLGLDVKFTNACDIYCISKDIAKDFDTEPPEEVYAKRLEPSMAFTINSVWPQRHEGSEYYLSELIKYNGGYGLFVKETDEIAAWALKNIHGQLGMVQTVERHQKKNYGSLVTKIMSKEIAKEGHNPLGTVLVENVASQAMFKKLGFSSLGLCYYLGITS